MKVIETRLKGCFIVEPEVYEDERGYFFESFNTSKFEVKTGIKIDFVQDNQSKSRFGVLRGLHYQKDQYAQAKLVRVLSGEVLDVAVDLRKESETFGHHISILLNSKKRNQLFIPRGFAHGFVVLSKSAEFFYKCDNYYNPYFEKGIHPIKNNLEINWRLPVSDIVISEKDKALPIEII